MNSTECINIIYKETMASDGFLSGTRESRIDEAGFQRLEEAIVQLTELTKIDQSISKLAVACLFEVPWELENTIPYYQENHPELAKKVSKMAGRLRDEIQDLLWTGLEEYYKNLE